MDLAPEALDVLRSFKKASESEFVLEGEEARPATGKLELLPAAASALVPLASSRHQATKIAVDKNPFPSEKYCLPAFTQRRIWGLREDLTNFSLANVARKLQLEF